MGLETIYHQNKPVLSISYFGNFRGMTEDEIDKMLRRALLDNWKTTRLWYKVEKDYKDFVYVCTPDYEGNIEEFAGAEEIYKNNKKVYKFYYAGGLIG